MNDHPFLSDEDERRYVAEKQSELDFKFFLFQAVALTVLFTLVIVGMIAWSLGWI